MKKRAVLIGIMISFLLLSCGTSTEITGSWKNPKPADQPIDNIMITAITGNTNARQTVENDLASVLTKSGIETTKSLDVFPPSFTQGQKVDKEAMLKKIKETDVEGILTIALIDEETENRYVPGTYGYQPVTRFGYYGRFWGYYTNWIPQIYQPGYYMQDKVYFIETNLYNAKNEELIWSAQLSFKLQVTGYRGDAMNYEVLPFTRKGIGSWTSPAGTSRF